MNREKLLAGLPGMVLLLALLFQVAYIVEQEGTATTEFFRYNEAFDSYRFISEAKIIEEEGFYPSSAKRTLPPLYPLLIAVTGKISGDSEFGLLLLQGALNIASLWLIYMLTLKWFGKRQAFLALLIASFYGPFYFYGGMHIRASLVTFESLAVIAILSAGTGSSFATSMAGLAMAALFLTRPYPISLAAVLAWLFYRLYKERNKTSTVRTVAFIASFSLVVFILPFPSGDQVKSNEEKSGIGALAHFLSGNILDSGYGYIWTDTPIKKRLLKESGGSNVKGVLLVLREIAGQPVQYAHFYTKKMRIFLGGFEPPSNYNYYLYRSELSRLLWIPFVSFGWIVPFAIIGILVSLKEWRRHLLLYLWFGGLFIGIYIFIIQSRYRLPIVPFFIIFGSVGIFSLYGEIAKRRIKKTLIYLALLIMAFYFCRFDHRPLPGAITGEDYHNLEIVHSLSGDQSKANLYRMKSKMAGNPG